MGMTLDVNDDKIETAKELARRERKSAAVFGFRPFPASDVIVTNAHVDAVREHDAGIP